MKKLGPSDFICAVNLTNPSDVILPQVNSSQFFHNSKANFFASSAKLDNSILYSVPPLYTSTGKSIENSISSQQSQEHITLPKNLKSSAQSIQSTSKTNKARNLPIAQLSSWGNLSGAAMGSSPTRLVQQVDCLLHNDSQLKIDRVKKRQLNVSSKISEAS